MTEVFDSAFHKRYVDGSGIVIDGQVVYGHDGFAGELGHPSRRRAIRVEEP